MDPWDDYEDAYEPPAPVQVAPRPTRRIRELDPGAIECVAVTCDPSALSDPEAEFCAVYGRDYIDVQLKDGELVRLGGPNPEFDPPSFSYRNATHLKGDYGLEAEEVDGVRRWWVVEFLA